MTKGPVIIITGTPGTGKTTYAQLLVNESPVPLKHINVSEWVKERDLFEEYDQEWQSYTVDEDRVRFQSVSFHGFNPYERSLAIR
jgi:adenylate kinase